MQVECLISYTDPDGEVYEAGQVYQVEPEVGLWLTMAAEGQFKVVEDVAGIADPAEPRDTNSDADAALQRPPVDRMVRRGRGRGR